MNRAPWRIYHIDQDFAWREIVSRAVGSLPNAVHAGSARCGTDGLKECGASRRIDLVVVEIRLPDRDGVSLIAEIQSQPSGPRILVLTARCDDFAIFRLGQSGIAGLVWKTDNVWNRLGVAIGNIRAGRTCFDPEFLAEQERMRRSPGAFFKILSRKEQALIPLLASGSSDDEIALRIGASASTVKWHRRRILARLDLHRTSDLMNWAREKGFIENYPSCPPCAFLQADSSPTSGHSAGMREFGL
jgi:two-component system secretion response regulator SsrB